MMDKHHQDKVMRMASRKSEQPSRQAIVVLGMHRSGTSAVGGVLAKLGVEPPKSLMLPGEDNPRGYWESSVITQFNDEVLASAGSSWNDWQEFNPHWIESAVGKQSMERLALLLAEEFGEARLFFIKDPRICRLLPVWLKVFSDLGISAKFVIPFRHPLEVARSLAARGDRFAPGYTLLQGQAQLVWLRHVLDAEFGSRGFDRALFRYNDLLADWRRQARRIGEELDIKWSRMSAVVETEIDEFLSADLRHEYLDDAVPGTSAISSWASETYQALRQLAEGGNSDAAYARLDTVRNELNLTSAIYAPVLHEVHANVKHRLKASTEHFSEYENKVAELDAKNGLLKQECVMNYELAMRYKASLEDVREQFHNREAAHVALAGKYESGQERITELESALSEARVTRSESEKALAGLKLTLSAAESAIEQARRERDQMAALHRDEVTQLGERLHLQIKALKHDKRAVEEAAQERTSEIVILSKRILELEAEVATRDGALKDLNRAVAALSAKIDAQARTLDEREARTQALFSELDAQAHIVSEYRRELETIRLSSPWKLPGSLQKMAGRAIHVPNEEQPPQADEMLLRKSRLFDGDWYLRRYPDVSKRRMDPVKHYLRYGAKEGRDPGPAFSTSGYRARHPDVTEVGINPLVHYLTYGRKEGRSIVAIESRTNKEDVKHAKQD
jgi:uncharacterized coiled-coil protein SlyX